ncbi:MAG: hypothetical protein P8I97_00280 [Verrucomicrobiales bacterium]|nr:hypothetical protein [Verrucomicrobiales bacterium]
MRVNLRFYYGLLTVVLHLACQMYSHGDTGSSSKTIEHPIDHLQIKQSKYIEDFKLLFEQGNFYQLINKTQDYLLRYEAEDCDYDVVTYFAAASHYHVGNHRAAHTLLNSFSNKYANSKYLESAQFYSASNLIKMHWWRAGVLALNDFIQNFPDSTHLADAFYDRASADYFFKDYNSCLNYIIKVEKVNKDPHLNLRTKLLKGYALKELDRLAESEGVFLIAKNKARLLQSSQSIAKSLLNLIVVSADQGRWRDSFSYYYIFMNDFKDSIYAINAAVAGIKMMHQMDKEDLAMKRFEEILFSVPSNVNVKGLNDALLKYAVFVQNRYGASTILVQLGNFLGRCEGPSFVREALVLAQLDILENFFPVNDQEIEVYYREIIREFNVESLSVPALLKLASHYRSKDLSLTSKLYSEVLDRGSSRYESEAIFGMAKIQSLSSDHAELKSSILGFRKIIEIFGDSRFQEESLSELNKLLESYKELSESDEILMNSSELIALVGKPRRVVNRKIWRN